MNVQHFLRAQSVPFEVLAHQATYDAQRMSQAVHVSGHHVAKTVLLRTGAKDEYVIAVLPASEAIDFVKTEKLLGSPKLALASELELAEHCADCEIGALPPFGSQYNMKTVIDQKLTQDEDIVFEGNTHNEAIKMKYADFERIEAPIAASICTVP